MAEEVTKKGTLHPPTEGEEEDGHPKSDQWIYRYNEGEDRVTMEPLEGGEPYSPHSR